jgi:hypothetical protein
MKAVVYKGPRDVVVKNVPDATRRPKLTKTLMHAKGAGPRSFLNRGSDTRIKRRVK